MNEDKDYGPLQAAGVLASQFGDDVVYRNADYNKFKAEGLYKALGGTRPTALSDPLSYVKAKDMPNIPGRLINAWSKAGPFIRPIAKVAPYVTAAGTLYDLYDTMQNRYSEEGPEQFVRTMIKD